MFRFYPHEHSVLRSPAQCRDPKRGRGAENIGAITIRGTHKIGRNKKIGGKISCTDDTQTDGSLSKRCGEHGAGFREFSQTHIWGLRYTPEPRSLREISNNDLRYQLGPRKPGRNPVFYCFDKARAPPVASTYYARAVNNNLPTTSGASPPPPSPHRRTPSSHATRIRTTRIAIFVSPVRSPSGPTAFPTRKRRFERDFYFIIILSRYFYRRVGFLTAHGTRNNAVRSPPPRTRIRASRDYPPEYIEFAVP